MPNPIACAPAVPNCNICALHLQCYKEDNLGVGGACRETLHFACNNGFKVGMLQVKNKRYLFYSFLYSIPFISVHLIIQSV